MNEKIILDAINLLRNDIKNEMKEFKEEIHNDMKEFKEEIHNEMQEFKEEMHNETKQIREEIAEFRIETNSKFENVENKLDETNCRLKKLEKITLNIEYEYGYKIDVLYENRYELYNKNVKNEINIEELKKKI